jgi:hypothetical protein
MLRAGVPRAGCLKAELAARLRGVISPRRSSNRAPFRANTGGSPVRRGRSTRRFTANGLSAAVPPMSPACWGGYERIVYWFKGKLIMKMRPVSVLVLAFLGFVLPSGAQTGTVTFYSINLSAKKQIKTALAPVGTVPFTGWLFDGDKRLAHATRGRFMSFQLPAGSHDFTVPYKSKGPGRKPCQPTDCLQLEMESGRHYCVRQIHSSRSR